MSTTTSALPHDTPPATTTTPPEAADSITALGAVMLSAAIQSRQLSCTEVMQAYLARIAQVNPQHNALVALQPPDMLLAQARERDAELARGAARGPLHGLPQAPKDIMPARGLPTTKGSLIYQGQVAQTDAVVFERMRRSGAIFVGRSNSPEFGLGGHTYNPVYGITRNAHFPALSAGGSSGGAAVAVARHLLPVADGSDMMGSLRTPAAFNGVFGLRTSVGCVPHGPAEEVFFQQFSVAGPMARDIPDLALLLSVQAGADPRLPLTRPLAHPAHFLQRLERDCSGLRIGWLGDLGGHLPTDAGLLALCQQALRHFDILGCQVEAASVNVDWEQLWHAWLTLRSFTFAGAHGALYQDPAKRALLKPEAVWEIERGLALRGSDVYAAARVRSAWYQTVMQLFDRFDFLVLPAAQVFPFAAEEDWPHSIAGKPMDSYHRWMETVVPATMASLPTLAAPAGHNAAGLPAGIQIMARPHDDFALLQIGHAYDLARR